MASEVRLLTDEAGLTFEYLDADETTFLYEEIFTRRAYEQHGVEVSKAGTPVIVDCGANIGLFSLHCLQENTSARVFAVEPSPTAFRCLERNLATTSDSAVCARLLLRDRAANKKHTLHCFPDAPGESTCNPAERRRQRDRLREHVGCEALVAESAGQAAASVAVEVAAATLSDLFAVWAVSHVDLLKVDVEGDELLVLRGIRPADWPKIRQVVCEVHDVHGRLEGVCQLLRRHGLRVTCELQRGGVQDGYEMVVPASLRLYYVYATRAAAGTSRGCKRARAHERRD